MTEPLHNHLVVRGEIRNPPQDTEVAITLARDLVEFLDMRIIQGPFAAYVTEPGNLGLTCLTMIETSHIAFHIWDETDPALLQLDIYTCGLLNQTATIAKLKALFDFTKIEYALFNRAEHLAYVTRPYLEIL